MLKRRTFLQASLAAAIASQAFAAPARRPKILLRSSWQVVNIGDIAHTPGVLALLEKYLPEAEVTLWASGDFSEEVSAMEKRRFPQLKVVKGSIGRDGKASNTDLQEAIQVSDFLLHGSGPSFVAARDTGDYVEHTGKPFGIYGITYGGAGKNTLALMNKAKLIYFRDSVSLGKAQEHGIKSPIMEFGPDGAFACDLRDDESADAFLQANDLEAGKFLCCIPRLRHTPYWLIKEGRTLDEKKHARNEEMKDHDHAPLREAITRVATETNHKILLCPEDKTQMQVGKDNIYDQLPAEVKKQVVWRENFWLTDQALSTYVRSAGFFGLEMHSPIMCVGNGVPAIVGRFAEQTSKGFMWKDIGLEEWLFDIDQPEQVARYADTVIDLIRQPEAAQEKVQAAQEVVTRRQYETMNVIRQVVGL
ncbi:polysaccharide pyruvyl transferase family protein [Blastopirellula marina]|uniref:Polysaccharide pyruvyl transferase family protein n=1 Tax=Blastopirellula marina TaxID=124 RepID=A0A2S8GMI9_9BACT|nr:polysaccharide pyruvyl transferase family protein [Blastopirellula marina]PQO45656.1 polysaccharide pyruvyl transferase family protein [Blastopirellula marina]